MKRVILFALMTMIPLSAFAGGTWSNVTISQVGGFTSEGYSPSGYVEILLSQGSTGNPSCSNSNKTYAIIDTSTAGGALAASLAQTALVTGAAVNITGTGTCGPFNSGVENVSNLFLL